ncbi:MAG TPA: CxxC-x17-CxxC domain-containing protein [Candidatus Nanoarchaeia archaeon]|nr:CxxC-x17-CxxC domain-containing protein [Candidatus Nanoarchaeia archaeon]
MGDFRKSKRSFGRRDSPGSFRRDSSDRPRRDSGGRSNFSRDSDSGRSSRPEMHEATCAQCGKQCEVPFRPINNKPVYCSNCFMKNDGSSGSSSGKSSSGELEQINKKLDKIMKALKIE